MFARRNAAGFQLPRLSLGLPDALLSPSSPVASIIADVLLRFKAPRVMGINGHMFTQ